MIGTLTPAYSRDYKNKKDLIADFNNGKDFVSNSITGTGYVNKQEVEKEGLKTITIRYGNNRKVTVLKFNATKQEWS
jgi:hypothetical protein